MLGLNWIWLEQFANPGGSRTVQSFDDDDFGLVWPGRYEMSERNDSLVERVQASYQQLSAAATTLNTASDALGESIAELDSALKRLNLGISSWVKLVDYYCEDPEEYSYIEVGYARIGGKWGIALRTVDGHEQFVELYRSEQWLFNDAPRKLRIEAVTKIPNLLEQLAKDAAAMTSEVEDKAGEVRQLASAMSAPPDEQSSRKQGRRKS